MTLPVVDEIAAVLGWQCAASRRPLLAMISSGGSCRSTLRPSIVDGFPSLWCLSASPTMVSVTSEPVPAPAAITAFAQRWAEAVVGTSYVSVEGGGLTAYLLGFTHRLVEAALVVEFAPSVGCQLGVEMIEAHFTGTQTLSKTLALIIEELPGLLVAARPGMNTASRVGQLVGSMAAGYAGALCERGLDEPDVLYNACLRAHRQAEQALAASEARFRAVFIEAGIGIGIADMEGNITDVNPALQRMFGY
jgi:PAS domain-containing protein